MTTPSPLTVGLVQINNSFSGQSYLPYAVACLESYTRRNAADASRYDFLVPVYKRVPADAAVEHLKTADVAAFSTYVWNFRLSLEIARRLKERRPGVTIIFGGPHVPDATEAFLREYPFIDVAVNGEGEQTFLALLESLPDSTGARSWDAIAGISFLRPDGEFVQTARRARLASMEAVPSPFLEGTFEPLIEANPEEAWIGLWETNRGCPFQCTYCDWGSATAAKLNRFDMDRLKGEVAWFARHKIEFIFCCDANFGILPRDVELAEWVAESKRTTGYPVALSVQNTKNATERAYQTQKILSDAGLSKGVAISMQTLDAGTLKNIKRDNISLDSYLELQRRFTKDRVETFSDIIIGLPGETYETFAEGVDALISSGQHNRVQFNNLSILPNAEMGKPEYIARHGLVTVQSEIINIHGARVNDQDDVREFQQMVVATATLPPEDWRNVRALASMTALLHFDKLLQIPLIICREQGGLRYRAMLEAFMAVDAADYPLIAGIRDFFLGEAASLQQGGVEYVYAPQWLGIYWPADEYVFIDLTARNQLEAFYEESHRLLRSLLGAGTDGAVLEQLADAVRVNRALIKQPFLADDIDVTLDWDILQFWNGIRQGEPVPLRRAPVQVLVERSRAHYADLQDWCREVVWWGNKKGAYLYTNNTIEKQLAGHY